MSSANWSVPAPNDADWVDVDGRTLGNMEAQATISIAVGSEGLTTAGNAQAQALAPPVTGAEGVTTAGDGAAQAVAPPVTGVQGLTTQGGGSSPTLAPPVTGAEGSTSQGDGASSSLWTPAQGRHLKPDHRWQMPQPRNLLSDPESFDPGSTAWKEAKNVNYIGVAQNVGPNGEAAAEIEWTGEFGAFQNNSANVTGDITGGFYVRAKTGTAQLSVDLGIVQANFSVGTGWTWISGSADGATDFSKFALRCLDTRTKPYRIYLLRAGMNLGDSLEYSTRSSVPQTIPDVVAGADLQNGSQSGADTNDLKFAVDGSGVPYAVSDGGDKTSTLPQDGTETWATRVYIPSSVGADVQFLGDSGYAYPTLAYDDTNGDLRLRYKDSGGTTQQGPRVSAAEGQWHAVAITIDGSDLRLNVGGTTDEQTGTDLSITADPRLLGTQSGARVQHPEQHPVLTEAEAEAVRQRLAQNPPDPVPPTEAWDFSGETNPHNLLPDSNDPTQWGRNQGVTLGTPGNVTGVNADLEATTVTEDSSDGEHNIEYQMGDASPYATEVFLKNNGRQYGFVSINRTGNWSLAEVDLVNNTLNRTDSGGSDPKNIHVSPAPNGFTRIRFHTAPGNTQRRITIGPSNGAATLGRFATYQGNGSDGVIFGGAQVVLGTEIPTTNPNFPKTTGSIAFPQTVPALRDSSNDLTLGSSSGADTNDPSWRAPTGLVGGASDDFLLQEPSPLTTASQFTFLGRVKSDGSKGFETIASTWAQGSNERTSLGWFIGQNGSDPELRVYLDFSENGGPTFNFKSGMPQVFNGSFHVVSVVVDILAGEMRAAIDANSVVTKSFDPQGYDFKNNPRTDMSLLDRRYRPFGGVMTTAGYYTRALTDEEALYARQRILDNPEDPFPEYTNP